MNEMVLRPQWEKLYILIPKPVNHYEINEIVQEKREIMAQHTNRNDM